MKIKNLLLFAAAASLSISAFADDLATGEWVEQTVGQPTNDHLFVRGDYNDKGEMATYDNTISFLSGSPQTFFIWLDDDEIYNNEAIQALTPILIKRNGNPYGEITYNSFQCDIYLPMSVELTYNDEDECYETNSDMRMPKSSTVTMGEKANKVIDGKEYRVYTVICKNEGAYGSHFSGYTAGDYEAFVAENGRSMRKDDAPLLAMYIQNNNQSQAEFHLDDMIIANQEFGFREAFTAEPKWEPNEYRIIYGEGGNGQPRFQKYNRVALYGSASVVENLSQKTVKAVKFYNVAGMESNVPFEGVNVKVTTYNDGTTSTCKVIK